MREFVGPRGERFEEGARRDRVSKEARPPSEKLLPAGNPADEEPRALSALLDDGRIELGAEEPPLLYQLLEVAEYLLSRRRMNRGERSYRQVSSPETHWITGKEAGAMWY